jgi:hypothetical protein
MLAASFYLDAVPNCHRHGDSSQRGDGTTRLTPIPASGVGGSDRSRTIVVRPRRWWRSARASEPRENQPAWQIAVEPLPAQTLHTSADQMVSWCRCGRSSCPPAGSAEGAALRRELHSCFADQPSFELKIRTPCHHGHARPIGQPNKRPDEGGGLYDVRACVAHLRVLKSAGNFTRAECHDLNAEKIQRVKCFMFTRCGIVACPQFSNAGAAGWVRKFQVVVIWPKARLGDHSLICEPVAPAPPRCAARPAKRSIPYRLSATSRKTSTSGFSSLPCMPCRIS